MVRPLHADSAATHDTIVQHALGILAEDGDPGALSLRRVASSAGTSVGTIQYYFDAKEKLLEACLDAHYGRLATLVRSLKPLVAGPDVDGRAVVEAAARAVFRFALQERTLARLGLWTIVRRGQLSPARQADVMGTWITDAARLLAPHIGLTEADARLSIQAFAAMVVRFALMSESERAFLTDLSGEAGLVEIEEYTVRAARRLFCQGER